MQINCRDVISGSWRGESLSTRCHAVVERRLSSRRNQPPLTHLYDGATRTEEEGPSTSAAADIGTALTLMRLERSLGRDATYPWLPSVLLSAPITEEPPQTKGKKDERPSDYFANVGDAIRTLRDDIPHLFDRDLNCGSHACNRVPLPSPACKLRMLPCGMQMGYTARISCSGTPKTAFRV